jgi:D-alanyl-D-alanine carboxypeptidase/D-alanyl-D-alanine-endopeptidase (penicillin-binding protein 4)
MLAGVVAAGPGAKGPAGNPLLEESLLKVLERYGEDPADWGMQVKSLERGDNLLHLNPGRRFMPASNLKLLVTAIALDQLGADYRWPTSVLAVGEIDSSGVLHGDLVLRGSGDPSISNRFWPETHSAWDSLASQVKAAGIRQVTGRLLADNTLFKGPYLASGWGWEDLNWWYAAPASALSYNDNTIDVQVWPAGKAGDPPRVEIKPANSPFTIANRARTVSSRIDSRLIIGRDTPGGDISLGGGIYRGSLGYLEHVAVDNPGLFAAEAFANALAGMEVRIDGPVTVLESGGDDLPGYLDSSPALVGQIISPPLSEIVRVINKRSHNFYAEQLLFTLGAVAGPEGSFAGGIDVEERVLRSLGVDTRELRLEDGSGLSRLNLITTDAFVSLLEWMDSHRQRDVFVASLPVAGRDNGVRQMRNTKAAGRLFAKTGYITSVMALSGYTWTGDGEKVAFSILGNNWLMPNSRARRIIRDLCVKIVDSKRPAGSAEDLQLRP